MAGPLRRFAGLLAILIGAGCTSEPPPGASLPLFAQDVPDAQRAADAGPSDGGASTADVTPAAAQPDTTAQPDTIAQPDAAAPEIGPARYPPGALHSPITVGLADGLRTMAASSKTAAPDVFAKIGASMTVSSKALHCFAGESVNLGPYTKLKMAQDYFLGGKAGSSTPFDRKTLAAKVGKTAKWAMQGKPSPVQAEIAAIDPGLALIQYGSNDMQMGTTYLSAMDPYYVSMNALIGHLVGQGVVPALVGIPARKDIAAAGRWVGTYNALVRGMAQRWQIPFVDLHGALADLPGLGLSGDKLHLNSYSGGACVLTKAGLAKGNNKRNLVILEMLERLRLVMEDKDFAPDGPPSPLQGMGTVASPYVIDQLPFVDSRDTSVDGEALIDVYPGCAKDTDESGNEIWYRLTLPKATPMRVVVADDTGVDVDIHLLDASATPDGCLSRNHKALQLTLPAGTVYLVVDTFTTKAEPKAGEFMLMVVPCDADDDACAKTAP